MLTRFVVFSLLLCICLFVGGVERVLITDCYGVVIFIGVKKDEII
mgnify:CR=1 FL=1